MLEEEKEQLVTTPCNTRIVDLKIQRWKLHWALSVWQAHSLPGRCPRSLTHRIKPTLGECNSGTRRTSKLMISLTQTMWHLVSWPAMLRCPSCDRPVINWFQPLGERNAIINGRRTNAKCNQARIIAIDHHATINVLACLWRRRQDR